MKSEPHLAFSRAIAVICMLIMASACNMASQDQEEEDSQYASQAQALSGAGNLPAGYGSSRLEYNHKFNFNYEGSNTVKVEITIKGEIPLALAQTAWATKACGDQKLKWPLRQVSGSGTVNFNGTADFTSGSLHCTCSLPDSIKVDVQGKTYFEYAKSGDKCQREMIALKVKETWGTEHKWQCTCNTPREAEQMHVQENMAMFPAVDNPELENKTMIFDSWCSQESFLKEDLLMSIIGSGTYQWTYRSGINEPSDPGNRVNQPSDLSQDQDQWWNGEPITFGSCIPGKWGPPLESIVQQTTSDWYPVQPASSP